VYQPGKTCTLSFILAMLLGTTFACDLAKYTCSVLTLYQCIPVYKTPLVAVHSYMLSPFLPHGV